MQLCLNARVLKKVVGPIVLAFVINKTQAALLAACCPCAVDLFFFFQTTDIYVPTDCVNYFIFVVVTLLNSVSPENYMILSAIAKMSHTQYFPSKCNTQYFLLIQTEQTHNPTAFPKISKQKNYKLQIVKRSTYTTTYIYQN